MCLYSKLIKNPKYKANKKNGGVIPEVKDHRTTLVPIGCQNCIECRKQKAREWQVRLLEEIRTEKNGKFITLTFSDKSIKELLDQKPTKNWASLKGLKGYDLDNEIATRAVRLWLERWRKKYKKSIRHWLVTELGGNGTENIHLHGIVWTNEDLKIVEKTWQYGWVWKGKMVNEKLINYVNESTVGYITKYVNKIDEKHPGYKSKILCSGNPGIGHNYLKRIDAEKNKYNGKKTIETYKTRTGHKMALPIYYRNKIYTEEEREKLWIQKIDKEERWIRGEKVDIKEGEEKYYELLKWHQKMNVELGYGDANKNWEKEQYERERRMLKTKERVERAASQQNIKAPAPAQLTG